MGLLCKSRYLCKAPTYFICTLVQYRPKRIAQPLACVPLRSIAAGRCLDHRHDASPHSIRQRVPGIDHGLQLPVARNCAQICAAFRRKLCFLRRIGDVVRVLYRPLIASARQRKPSPSGGDRCRLGFLKMTLPRFLQAAISDGAVVAYAALPEIPTGYRSVCRDRTTNRQSRQ
jgi:hypothetical protein